MTDSVPPPSEQQPTDASLTLDYLLRRMRFKSDFPALSSSITRVQALSHADGDSLHALCDEILKDVALTQKLLRVVNTAHYRRAGMDPISTVSRAVTMIGLGGVRNIALSLLLLDHMEDKVHAQQLKTEFLRTVMAGTLAAELSEQGKGAEEAFLGALFSNLGRLLVAFYLPEDADQIRGLTTASIDNPQPLSEAQAALNVLGVSMDQLGAFVGQSWGLPDGLIECMSPARDAVPSYSLAARPERLVWLARLANDAADAMLNTEPVELGLALERLSRPYGKALEVSATAVQDAAARARTRLTELTQVLSLHVPAQSPAERLLDHFYVDAPNARNGDGPSADDLGLTTEYGTLVPCEPLVTQDPVSTLTHGIQDITNTLVEPFKLNDVLQMILETILRALDCRCVVFGLRDARTGHLIGRMGLGEGADVVKAALNVQLAWPVGALPDLFAAVTIKQADTLIADAAAPNIAPRLPAWFKSHVPAQTFLLLPLVMKRSGHPDVVLGLIYADKAQAGSLQLNEQVLSLLRTLRNQAVMAFKQAAGA